MNLNKETALLVIFYNRLGFSLKCIYRAIKDKILFDIIKANK